MKTGLFRSTLLACAIGCGLMPLAGTVTADAPNSLAQEVADIRYFVYFDDTGVVDYAGGIPGLPRTAADERGARLDGASEAVVLYRSYLADEQARQVGEIGTIVGRTLQPVYRYDVLFSGVVLTLSPSEAALAAGHPEVVRVEQVKNYELATDRGPAFIGADTIWDGTNTGDAGPSRGEGVVIGVLDTGINAAHPSFANDASCGFSAQTPKLIAAKDCVNSSDCSGPAPEDTNGHGSHTASTAGGNTHVATGGALAGTQVSGIAPCARIITYRVCPSTCPGDAIQAGIQTALLDQVDVVNFSISGGANPWSPSESDRGFLDLVDAGIFVAASAGNTRPEIPNPIGQVNHRGPWMMTVANSSHDRINKNRIDVAGGPQDVYGLESAAPFVTDIAAPLVDASDLGNPIGCTAGGGFPAGSMLGQVALVNRGSCTFEEKINNAVAAGAIAVVVTNNNAAPPIPMAIGAATSVPSLMISQVDGQAISQHLDSQPGAVATIDADTAVSLDPIAGDILSASSLRGPIGGGIEVTKPDITGPGTNIYAAVAGGATDYDFLSGTSMSGPHLAGSAALVRSVRPDWTVPEIKSAIMMTAKKTGQKDFVNGTPNTGPWDADDVGSGRVDLTKAARAGLVMHETKAVFLAAEGSVGNQRALNLPSARNTDCTPSCSWTRTVRNTLSGESNWTASAANITPGFDLEVSPADFSFNGEGIPHPDTLFANGFEIDEPAVETQQIVITATPTGDLTGAVAFGEVVLAEAADRSPDLHVTVAIKGSGGAQPPVINVTPASISASAEVGGSPDVRLMTVANVGGSDLTWSLSGDIEGSVVIWDQPSLADSGIVSTFSTAQASGAYTANDFTLLAGASITDLVTPGFDNQNALAAQSSITWAIYADAAGVPAGDPETNPGPAIWTYSSPVNGAGVDITDNTIRLNLPAAAEQLDLPAGTFWLTVFPTYPDITVQGAARWNWFRATQMGAQSQLISPVLFGGIPDWTATGAGGLGTATEDTAMTIVGQQSIACGASWLSVDPTVGLVAPAGSQAVDVTADPTGLPEGTYEANVCIASNDPETPVVVVPVTFDVVQGGGSVVYEQGFANVPAMFAGGGWFQKNNSQPLGASTFVQGAAALAPAQDGSNTEYVLVNFNSATGAGTISNWMLTPEITFDANTSLSFYTRAPVGSTFPDRLEVRVSSSGAGTNVGTLATDVGDFTTLLLTVNPTLAVGGYPTGWTQFTLTNADGIPVTGSGRVAFRYFVTNGGPAGSNSDIIGIDTVSITAAAVDGQVIEQPNMVVADTAQTQVRGD
jgi:subtilisin family serine protease